MSALIKYNIVLEDEMLQVVDKVNGDDILGIYDVHNIEINRRSLKVGVVSIAFINRRGKRKIVLNADIDSVTVNGASTDAKEIQLALKEARKPQSESSSVCTESGSVYADLDELPSDANAGKFKYMETDTSSALYVCIKTSSDTYAWAEVAGAYWTNKAGGK